MQKPDFNDQPAYAFWDYMRYTHFAPRKEKKTELYEVIAGFFQVSKSFFVTSKMTACRFAHLSY
jgi:hypothetical protein